MKAWIKRILFDPWVSLKRRVGPKLKANFPSVHCVFKKAWLFLQSNLAIKNNLVVNPPLSLPAGTTEESLFKFLSSIGIDNANKNELSNYLQSDFKRFLYTCNLVNKLSGKALELGANPYYTSMLLREFTQLDLCSANYFGSNAGDSVVQTVTYSDFHSGSSRSHVFNTHHFNIEEGFFPFEDDTFDVVLFCEIIEHLTLDPLHAMREIKRVLKPDGRLILTTPNVNRLENVTRMISGENIYDPYSGYGPYGRHNREYTVTELDYILKYLGFSVEILFTADVHPNNASHYFDVDKVAPFLKKRRDHLGQYIFIRAQNSNPARQKKPAFLFRSYPQDELEA